MFSWSSDQTGPKDSASLEGAIRRHAHRKASESFATAVSTTYDCMSICYWKTFKSVTAAVNFLLLTKCFSRIIRFSHLWNIHVDIFMQGKLWANLCMLSLYSKFARLFKQSKVLRKLSLATSPVNRKLKFSTRSKAFKFLIKRKSIHNRHTHRAVCCRRTA